MYFCITVKTLGISILILPYKSHPFWSLAQAYVSISEHPLLFWGQRWKGIFYVKHFILNFDLERVFASHFENAKQKLFRHQVASSEKLAQLHQKRIKSITRLLWGSFVMLYKSLQGSLNKITRYYVTELVSLFFSSFCFTHLTCALIGRTELLRHVIKEEEKN